MDSFDQFHDGFYNGLLIRESSVDFFVASWTKKRFVLSATDVVALFSADIREGNIIYDVVCCKGVEITPNDIRDAYGFSDSPRDDPHVQRALGNALGSELSFLRISASYGGTCAVLANTFTLRNEGEWISQMCVEKP